MGISSARLRCKSAEQDGGGAGDVAPPGLHASLLASLYHRRVVQLADEASASPPSRGLKETLQRCIAFCYGVTPEWAPHVRVTVFADNPSENQMNVPVLDTLLVGWGVPGAEQTEVRCTPVVGTDVSDGRVVASPFWSRCIEASSGQRVICRDLIHQLLHWFMELDHGDDRKQLLVNILLQLHEACYNCIGRHKEVFEYCVYDLIDAESADSGSSTGAGADAACASPVGPMSPPDDLLAASLVVRRAAAHFLDRHKRAALHAAAISPLKFLFQGHYEVFENLDSHGASFWVAVLTEVFFPGLQMPFESIVELDKGWAWGAVDFLPAFARGGPAQREALERLSAAECMGRDWRQLTAGLRPSGAMPRRLPGILSSSTAGFRRALLDARRPNSVMRRSLSPYAERFAGFMATPLLLRRFALQASASERWDLDIGPALAALSQEALGERLSPPELRERLLCGAAGVDDDAVRRLLRRAGVAWADAGAP